MPIESIKLMSDHEASLTVETEGRQTVRFRAYTVQTPNLPPDTTFDVLQSTRFPAHGDPYSGWSRLANGNYVPQVPPKNPNCVVVFKRATRLLDAPWVFDVEIEYEGLTSPLAIPPDINYDDVPYLDARVQDIHGAVKTNSALDPYEEGTEVDANRQRLTIVRNIPYEDWDPDFTEGFKNTRNLLPYRHGGLRRPTGVMSNDLPPIPITTPIESERGMCKISSITARRMVRLKHTDPAQAKYYWQVRAVIDIDQSQYTDNNGNKQFKKWNRVLVDAGYNERIEGKLRRIISSNGPASSPQLLNGAGARLITADVWSNGADTDPPDLPSVPTSGPEYPVPEHDYFVCRSGQALRIPAPGVMGNDHQAAGGIVSLAANVRNGTLTLFADGSFVYVADAGYRGWDWFDYRLTTGVGTNSGAARVSILVGPVPRVRVFEDYPYKDWSAIASIIGGW